MIFKKIGVVFLWIFYVLITNKERHEYLLAKERGHKVSDPKNGIFSGTIKCHINEPVQKRGYLNWKEFKELRWPK